MKKRFLALLLCLLMLLALLPTAALAETENPGRGRSDADNRTHELPEKEWAKSRRGATRGRVDQTEALQVGENTFTIATAGDVVYRPFTPAADGMYRIYSTLIDEENPYTEENDTFGYLEDSNGNQLTSNDDSGEYHNFSILHRMTAGETYYLGVSFLTGSYTGTIPVTIKRFDLDQCGDNLRWSYKDGRLTITGTGDMWDFAYFETPWDACWDELTEAVFPAGMTSIGECAFVDFPELKSVTIPGKVTRIGAHAFEDCRGLKAVSIPASVYSIGAFAFYSCSALSDLTLSDGLAKIQYCAFQDCTSLTRLRIPETVKYLAYAAFQNCTALTTVILSKAGQEIYAKAFNGCEALKDVYYIGTELQRNEYLEVEEEGNEPLLNATWHYLKSSYTVTFDSNGGSAVDKQTVNTLDTAKKPKDPTKRGYVFKGWYQGSTAFDFSTPIMSDVTLKAKWEKIPAFDGTVTLNPNDVQLNGKTPYVVYNGKAQKPGVIVKDKSGKTLAASQYTVTYYDNTNPGTAYADVIIKSTGAYASVWFKIYLPPTASTTVENVQNGIHVSWKAVPAAKGYVIYRRAWNLKDAGWTKFERWNNTTKTTWVDTKVYAGTRYQYGVKAYFANAMDNYNLGIVGPLKTTVRITTRTLNSVTPGSKKLTVKWTGSSLFTGYQVQVATDAAFTKDLQTVTVAKAKTYETTVKGLKKATTYYVRVRSYHVFEGTTYYGQWSNILNGKTK